MPAEMMITEFIKPADNGTTSPYLCRLENGAAYYVKGRRALARGLIGEVVAAKLGQAFGLPIPDYEIVRAPQELLNLDDGAQNAIGSGPCFASALVPNLAEMPDTALKKIGRPFQQRLFLFDYWIKNEDRTGVDGQGNPNLFLNLQTNAPAVFDHNLALGFRLAARRVRRISSFFHDINPAVYSNTVQMLREELKQHQSSAKGESAKALFRHLIHGRESIVTFSEPRAAVTKLGFEGFIEEVYERNVMRSFITPEYREALIAKSIRGIFKTHRIRGYKKLKIADEIVPITFDLGSTHNGLRVIKPLAFDQKSTLAIIDHGAQWQSRLEHLLRRQKLSEDNVLLAVDPAVDLAEEHAEEARDAALGGLRNLGVHVVLRDDVQQIVRFALPGSTDDLIQTH